jgi:hypothetical protein
MTASLSQLSEESLYGVGWSILGLELGLACDVLICKLCKAVAVGVAVAEEQGHFRNPVKWEHPPLEANTEQRQ